MSSGVFSTIPDTECALNPDSPSCQKPFYTDDQSEYLYDLGASWAFHDGIPDNSGPTVFYGANTGNLTSRTSDSASGDTKTEQYVDGAGAAETNTWGRGTWMSTDITVTGSKIGSNSLGDYLINGPYAGECGDGIQDAGESSTNCPADAGTPDVALADEPSPDRDMWYDSTGSMSVSLPDDGAPSIDTHLDGGYGREPDYHTEGSYVDGSETNKYIFKDTVSQNTENIGSITHYYEDSTYTGDHYSGNKDESTGYYTGEGSTNSQNFCTTVNNPASDYLTDTISWDNGGTVSTSGPQMEYEAVDDFSSGTASVDAEYNPGFSGSKYYECTADTNVDTQCDQNVETDIYFNEGGSKDYTVADSDTSIIFQTQYNGNDPDYRESDGDIVKDTVTKSEIKLGSVTHHYAESNGTVDEPETLEDKTTYQEGWDATSSNTYCDEIGGSGKIEEGTMEFESSMKSFAESVDEYDAPNYYDATLEADITYNSGVKDSGDEVNECTNTVTITDECDEAALDAEIGDSATGSCADIATGSETVYTDSTTHNVVEESTNEVDISYEDYTRNTDNTYCSNNTLNYHSKVEDSADVSDTSSSSYTFTYDDYSRIRNSIWGPVDDTPEMFNNYFSGVEVHNTDFGYHSDSSNQKIDAQGSNDPSVSANRYELFEVGSNFVADNVESHVSDADGPDGEGNGMVAYKEGSGIQGTSEGVFNSEYWNGNPEDYISDSDLAAQTCPGDTIRCLISLDIKTKQTGWSNKEDSFNIEIE